MPRTERPESIPLQRSSWRSSQGTIFGQGYDYGDTPDAGKKKFSDEETQILSYDYPVSYDDPETPFYDGQTPYRGNQNEDTTHLLPSRPQGERKRDTPMALSWPVALGIPLVVLCTVVALELGVFFSKKNNGLTLPAAFSNTALTSFLLSSVPPLFVLALAFLYRELDWFMRWYQPYVTLHRGNASASEALLLDYIALGPLFSIFRARRWGHWVVFWSSATAILTYALQPLAASVFSIQQKPMFRETTVRSIRDVGLNPTLETLDAFVTAAGFASAATFNGIKDAPFTMGGWATAEFVLPEVEEGQVNATVIVHTTGVQTKVNCQNPKAEELVQGADGGTYLRATRLDGCVVNVRVDADTTNAQYGIVNTNCTDHGEDGVALEVQPVMFWFAESSSPSKQARAVFCQPRLNAFKVRAEAWLQSRDMAQCTQIGDLDERSNVTRADGRAFNGIFTDRRLISVVFPSSADTYIQAKAVATNALVAGAVFRLAAQDGNGDVQGAFDDPNGFLGRTIAVYTRHLSLTAKNIYFIDYNTTLPGTLKTLEGRVVVAALPAHALAVLLLLIGIVGAVLQFVNYRRPQVVGPLGGIAAVVARTAHAGWSRRLWPGDTAKDAKRKLEGLRFGVDPRTGAIVQRGVGVGGRGKGDVEGR
ncbi:hypothetical protein CYLTODRAFT_473525 [Cylindrobasidium torrendii FP15055 ss-10]|uniref:Uncharacterized protein n=1 Tax=Cylindrobasidium torrendii FP15055 ss-10 TaxID=1314674 RepID=A0A0D7AZY1_9AGAR|nr:hypothetical protein CYLTODRAFT_473525 [Cylindrobasidium torrendii FP15055 ss-10]